MPCAPVCWQWKGSVSTTTHRSCREGQPVSESAGPAALGHCRYLQGSGEFIAGPGKRRGLFCTCTSAGIPAFSSVDRGFLAGKTRLFLQQLLTLVCHRLREGQVCLQGLICSQGLHSSAGRAQVCAAAPGTRYAGGRGRGAAQHEALIVFTAL